MWSWLKRRFKKQRPSEGGIYICGASRGRYGVPILIDPALKFVDEDETPHRRPYFIYCEYPKHYAARGRTRALRKESYFQKWELTEQEYQAAFDAYDIMSLDMPPRVICPECSEKVAAETLTAVEPTP